MALLYKGKVTLDKIITFHTRKMQYAEQMNWEDEYKFHLGVIEYLKKTRKA